MSDSLVILLPLPPDSLRPNARPHWARKAADTKASKALAAIVTRQAIQNARSTHKADGGFDDGGLRFPWSGASFKALFSLPRKQDDDNLIAWLKAYRDGIASAGVVVNDSKFRMLPVKQVSGKKRNGGRYFVRITIERVDCGTEKVKD